MCCVRFSAGRFSGPVRLFARSISGGYPRAAPHLKSLSCCSSTFEWTLRLPRSKDIHNRREVIAAKRNGVRSTYPPTRLGRLSRCWEIVNQDGYIQRLAVRRKRIHQPNSPAMCGDAGVLRGRQKTRSSRFVSRLGRQPASPTKFAAAP